MVVCLSFYSAGAYWMLHHGYTPVETVAFSFVLAIAGTLWFVPRPNRGRAIPKRIRQVVIERDLQGAKFDATIHHIDHIVPFSKGGDHSLLNLRILPKRDNLSRGAKMPTMRDFRKKKA
jgi:5-methylcytosine-specific restriction endonuclease McrA